MEPVLLVQKNLQIIFLLEVTLVSTSPLSLPPPSSPGVLVSVKERVRKVMPNVRVPTLSQYGKNMKRKELL